MLGYGTFASWDISNQPTRVLPGHLPLRRGSTAVDAGIVVPNISADFVGEAPDFGADPSLTGAVFVFVPDPCAGAAGCAAAAGAGSTFVPDPAG